MLKFGFKLKDVGQTSLVVLVLTEFFLELVSHVQSVLGVTLHQLNEGLDVNWLDLL